MAKMMNDKNNVERNIEKHMSVGCMSGFFNIFDRSHIISGKHLYPKRLPPPLVNGGDSVSETVSSTGSPALSREFEMPNPKPKQLQQQQPEKDTMSVPKSPSPASPWKFTRETPRLSLDSRAITDGKGGLRPREIRINSGSSSSKATCESPSVIARLMGLEPLPSNVGSSGSGFEPEPEKKSELRRSASESRSRDFTFVDNPKFVYEGVKEKKVDHFIVNKQQNSNSVKKNQVNNNQRRRSYYDTTDFYPSEVPANPEHQTVSVYGEIERRLRTKGMKEPSKDLETLKHILEALQLKGLLHSSSTSATNTIGGKSVHNRRLYTESVESPIVLMKSVLGRPASPTNHRRRNNNNNNYNVASSEPSLSPRRDNRPVRIAENRNSSATVRLKGGIRNSNSPVRSPRPLNVETVSKSPRRIRSTAEIKPKVHCGPTFTEDEMSTISASSFSTSSHTDNEFRDGRNLLERCDKLLHNIAEITANNSSCNSSAELQQPSPVSVLDSSFYKEEEESPSPIKKRTIDFKDHAEMELEDELWGPSSRIRLNRPEDPELSYVSDVIRAFNYFPDDDNLFFLLEKQISIRGIGSDKSKVSVLQRKAIFDTIIEILDRNRSLPPWKAVSVRRPVLDEVWAEFEMVRQQGPSEDLLEVICGVLKKDLSRDSINGLTDFPIEMSEAVLDIERLIFKDLIGESIRDLALLAWKNNGLHSLCRKLVF